jgi:DUF4097 and DUF4098 domain-containing protein YvlB
MPPPLKSSFTLLLILLASPVSACVATSEGYTDLEPRVIEPLGLQSLLLQVDYGEVHLFESMDQQIHVDGQTLFADELEYTVDSTDSQISIRIFAHHNRSASTPLRVDVLLPSGLQVQVETQDASVQAQGFQSDLEITSTSGDITLEKMTGELTLRSNRGNIAVQESSGVVSVVGNYGTLTAQNVRGDVGISTIMGNIVFGGSIQRDDTVRVETDHGSVSVNLSADSDLRLQVRSTSGDVACMLPDVVSSTRTCEGQVALGNGSLSIRTVSGAVTLQMTP